MPRERHGGARYSQGRPFVIGRHKPGRAGYRALNSCKFNSPLLVFASHDEGENGQRGGAGRIQNSLSDKSRDYQLVQAFSPQNGGLLTVLHSDLLNGVTADIYR